MERYVDALAKLNPAQTQAVESIDGPVMVIAGPGTGKTQVLALRIAHIRSVTDTPADGILCLTFTNAGVKAMRERLLTYMGPDATKVRIATFHGFGLELIETYYKTLGFDTAPTLLDDTATIALFDTVLHARAWEYLRPRGNASMYYQDLKSLISNLKRDGITPEQFEQSVVNDIERIKSDPESISSRGESKGQLKKDAEKKNESLERTREAAQFYAAYEQYKHDAEAIDYNDVLSCMVAIARESDEARAAIQERFLYVLIDEHQDSSGVQNAFLEAVWKDVERPNLFVVGDDRQLIYGFGGASLAYFEGFKHAFGTAKLITLTDNYRSTQTILDAAETLLTSSLADGTLKGNSAEAHRLRLVEAMYDRDEIIVAAHDIKARIEAGIKPEDCAILVPKNRQVKSAVAVLRDNGIPVAAGTALKLFELSETQTLLSVLRVFVNPFDAISLSRLILDPLSGIAPLAAHTYLQSIDARKLSLQMLIDASDESVSVWGEKLSEWLSYSHSNDAYAVIQKIGNDLLLASSTGDEMVRRRVEIVRTMLHLALSQSEKGSKLTVTDFLALVDRLQEYGEDIPLAVFGAHHGVNVLTLHGSKGLEYDNVWIAHMDEKSLISGKRGGFTFPRDIESAQEEAAEEVAKRQLYVAITRAKRFCTISYARMSLSGADQQLAGIVASLPEVLFEKQTAAETEEQLLATNPKTYVQALPRQYEDSAQALTEIVAAQYEDLKVSVTLLNTFFECPWKWYFRSLLKLPEPKTESLMVGTIVHAGIEYALDKTGHTTEELHMEIARVAQKEARYDDALAKRLAIQATKIVESWYKTYYPSLAKPYDREVNLNYRDNEFPHLHITGKIDLVEEIITDEVRVTDWKTGSSKTSGEIEKSDDEGRMSSHLRQLAMYSYLIDGHSHGNKSVTESRLVYLEAKTGDKNAVQSRKITSDEVERLRQDIKDYDNLLKSGEWISRPCNAKLYRAGDECEYCTMAKRFGVKGFIGQ